MGEHSGILRKAHEKGITTHFFMPCHFYSIQQTVIIQTWMSGTMKTTTTTKQLKKKLDSVCSSFQAKKSEF